ncbi:effector binding domain-containing protein [Priestia megaterium]|uniref:AraC family transcriptional regulator n=1 Tax=Priestia megaterium TaxID=1404 RepID=A0A6M6E0I8_PRIMG|nr:effector binding domain-containing protein [Priestia megaterium]QJX80350.1 AraC family transcriptional regulator [Priestia megaterium]
MKLKILKSIRTNNFNDIYLVDKIQRIWREASTHLPQEKVATYGVYHKYNSNYKGDYTLSISIEGNSNSNNSDITLNIPDDTKYKQFQVDCKDELGVINTWKKIWDLEENGELNRAYSYDFEKYFPDGKIEIYIALA